MKRPLRLEICKILDEHQALTINQIIEILKPHYKHEKQIYATEEHILSLRAVGIVELVEEWTEEIDNQIKLIQKWTLTKFGKEKYLKYW